MGEKFTLAKVTPNPFIGPLSGKMGNVVFLNTPSGVVMRGHTYPRNPKTTAQQQGRWRFAQASAAFGALEPAQRLLWEFYADEQKARGLLSSSGKTPTARSSFLDLAQKVLQVDPDALIPALPPAAVFFGDVISVTAQGIPGGVRFQASGPNTEGVVTELLLETLRGPARQPCARNYRPQAFVGFTAEQSAFDALLRAAWVCPAYRFVRPATGQATAFAPLPRLTLG